MTKLRDSLPTSQVTLDDFLPLPYPPDAPAAEKLAAAPATPGEGGAVRATIAQLLGTDILIGLKLRLGRTTDHYLPCCNRIGIIDVDDQGYAIHCFECDRLRGWLRPGMPELLRTLKYAGKLNGRLPTLRDDGIAP